MSRSLALLARVGKEKRHPRARSVACEPRSLSLGRLRAMTRVLVLAAQHKRASNLEIPRAEFPSSDATVSLARVCRV